MSFPIRKNTSVAVDLGSTLDIFVSRKLKELGIRVANNDLAPEQKKQIQDGIRKLKELIYVFVEELQNRTNAAGNQSTISIGDMESFINLWDLASEDLEDQYRDYLPSFGLDVEELDETLNFFEEIKASGFKISNSKSSRPNRQLRSDFDLVQQLSSLMQSSSEELIPDSENSLDDSPIPSEQKTSDNIIGILVAGTKEERESFLQEKYNIDPDLFYKILTNYNYGNTSNLAKAHPEQISNACKSFVEAAISQGSSDQVGLDREDNVSQDMNRIIGVGRIESNDSESAKTQELNGTQMYNKYFNKERTKKKLSNEISTLIYPLISDIQYSASLNNPYIRSLSNPYSESEISEVQNKANNFFSFTEASSVIPDQKPVDFEKIQRLNSEIARYKDKLAKAPESMKRYVQKSIDDLENELKNIQQPTGEMAPAIKPSFTSGLTFNNMNKEKKEQIKYISTIGQRALKTYRQNPKDIGALGVAVEKYGDLYNFNSNKSIEKANEINKMKDSLIQSAWFRYISPAYRFLDSANEFRKLISVSRSGVQKETSKEVFKDLFDKMQKSYIKIVDAKQDGKESSKLMGDFFYIASDFFHIASNSLTSESDRIDAAKIVAEMFKYHSLMNLNLNSPQSVIIFKEPDKNVQQTQITANSNRSAFTIAPSYRIK